MLFSKFEDSCGIFAQEIHWFFAHVALIRTSSGSGHFEVVVEMKNAFVYCLIDKTFCSKKLKKMKVK